MTVLRSLLLLPTLLLGAAAQSTPTQSPPAQSTTSQSTSTPPTTVLVPSPSPSALCGLVAAAGARPAPGTTTGAAAGTGGTRSGTASGSGGTSGAGTSTTGAGQTGGSASTAGTGTGTGSSSAGSAGTGATGSGSSGSGQGSGNSGAGGQGSGGQGSGSAGSGSQTQGSQGTGGRGTSTPSGSAATGTGSGANTSTAARTTDACFATQAALSDQFEIRTSGLAAGRSARPEVKAFAQRLIQDHTAATRRLTPLAAPLLQRLPTALDTPREVQYRALQVQQGDAFDRAFLAAQVSAHEQAVNLFTTYSKAGTHAGLRAHAASSLPALQQHLQRARELLRAVAK
ncbi:DUF4142 domain-containing protein [Deinococcus aquaedulcis]|uniref:DUF4142 domain-containing protein n=1 Tax=Deinococcus aquaedulcis TaxID=2840455 RepID=UPI001C8315A7|nr:DUF4142 domain-containing protein [Deinococcus aquaedulcis]